MQSKKKKKKIVRYNNNNFFLKEAYLSSSYFLFLVFIYLFIWPSRVLVASCEIFLCSTQLSRCGKQASIFVARWLSWSEASRTLTPRPGIESASPALQGGFLTTGPPGKSPPISSWIKISWVCSLEEKLWPTYIYTYMVQEHTEVYNPQESQMHICF